MKNINLALFYTILSSIPPNQSPLNPDGSNPGAIAGGVIVVIVALAVVGAMAIVILIFM